MQAGKQRFDTFRAAVRNLQAQLIPAREEARDRLDESAGVVLAWVIFTGAVILLSMFFVARGLRKRLVLPLERLSARVREVAGGDYDREVVADGTAEVVDLAHDIDTMRARIVAELEALRESPRPTSSAPTPSSSSSPTWRRTTSRSRCARSPASASCCSSATAGSSTIAPTSTSTSPSTARGGCRT